MHSTCSLICCFFLHLGLNPYHVDTLSYEWPATEYQASFKGTAPEVRILSPHGWNNQSGQVSSKDQPAFWNDLTHNSLEVSVRIPEASFTGDHRVTLLLDGIAVPQTQLQNRSTSNNFVYNLPYLAPGKHQLQARYLSDHVWSHLSPPIYFRIRSPKPPKIVAINQIPVMDSATANSEAIRVGSGNIKIQLADVNPNDLINVYVDGIKQTYGVPVTIGENGVVVLVANSADIVPGVHDVTVRTTSTNGMSASLLSNAVQFHYYDEDEYVLGSRPRPFSTSPHLMNRTDFAPSRKPGTNPTKVTDPTSSIESAFLGGMRSFCQGLTAQSLEYWECFFPSPRIKWKSQRIENLRELEISRVKALVIAERNIEIARAARLLDVELDIKAWDKSEKRSFHFATPAHFALREYSPQGQTLQRDGVIIYENMRFTFDEFGRYKVKFDVSTPAMPANVLLQFHVKDQSGQWYSITAPPVHVDPSSDLLREQNDVEFDGESEVLKRCFTTICKVRRNGAAQFGHGILHDHNEYGSFNFGAGH